MKSLFLTLLSLTSMLGACSSGASPTDNFPSTAIELTPPLVGSTTTITQSITEAHDPQLIETLQIPSIDQSPDTAPTTTPHVYCGHQWAYKDLPELSIEFEQAIQLLQPQAQASAFVFGEDCFHADGTTRTFIPMETDFNVTLPVNDVYNESDLGAWIVKVMKVIENVPSDQIIGPRSGRVTIVFQSGNNEQNVTFYIDRYQRLSPNLSSLQVFTVLASP